MPKTLGQLATEVLQKKYEKPNSGIPIGDLAANLGQESDGVALINKDNTWTLQDGYGYEDSEETYGDVIFESSEVQFDDGYYDNLELTKLPQTSQISIIINQIEYKAHLTELSNKELQYVIDGETPISELFFYIPIQDDSSNCFYIIVNDEELVNAVCYIKIQEINENIKLINNKYQNIKKGTAMYSLQSGYNSFATAPGSYAEGYGNIASGWLSHAEGEQNTASGHGSHVENGPYNTASGERSHVEGNGNNASGIGSHAEGHNNIANGTNSHVEGQSNIANGENSHVIGKYNVEDTLDNWNEWVAGTSYIIGDRIKYNNWPYECKKNNNSSTFNHQEWIAFRGMNYPLIVGNGNGTRSFERSNAYALDWDGNGHYKGDVYVGANADSTGGTKLATVTELNSAVGDLIAIQSVQPTDPDTKIWIDDDASGSVQVPTVSEMNSALATKVDDVQVNGVSVVTNGVANVPIASALAPGVVKYSNSAAIVLDGNNCLKLSSASSGEIKQGVSAVRPFVVANQHEAVFYGLAKAAGADMAQSSNAVGTYTDAAKTAIKNMIGVEEGLKVVRLI